MLLIPLLLFLPPTTPFSPLHTPQKPLPRTKKTPSTTSRRSSTSSIDTLNTLLPPSKLFPDLCVTISPSTTHRYGLVATRDLKSNQAALSVPYQDDVVLTAARARKVLEKYLPPDFEGWTGDVGLIALLLLAERSSSSLLETRRENVNEIMSLWASTLPSKDEMGHHPLFWSEDDQETLQSSSTKKVYQLLDDIDEDAAWLSERVWDPHRDAFPSSHFNPKSFLWAVAQVTSRSVFVDGTLRLIPILDYANHSDGLDEIEGDKYFGTFGTTKGVQLLAPKGGVKRGEELCVSYGPKNGIEYLLEYGFVPDGMREEAGGKYSRSFSELTFEVDEKDRFYDDKMDILEFETDNPPMNPVQTFDVGGKDGEPDPSMVQFLRLVQLGATDAFLLESIFRKEVWGFMFFPVSQKNEEAVVEGIIEACNKALNEMEEADLQLEGDAENGDDGEEEISYQEQCCKVVRDLEKKALSKTIDYMQREKEALDLKEYYQERRLKDLGLDSQWDEDEMNPDVGWGQTRAPGGGDLDW